MVFFNKNIFFFFKSFSLNKNSQTKMASQVLKFFHFFPLSGILSRFIFRWNLLFLFADYKIIKEKHKKKEEKKLKKVLKGENELRWNFFLNHHFMAFKAGILFLLPTHRPQKCGRCKVFRIFMAFLFLILSVFSFGIFMK